jgi:hypothetical protein
MLRSNATTMDVESISGAGELAIGVDVALFVTRQL